MQALFASEPLLVEVTPSQENVRLPDEMTDESRLESWVATPSGGFTPSSALQGDLSSMLRKQSLGITKRRTKKAKKPVEYFVNHCEKTKCIFAPGHEGLCSHERVHCGLRFNRGRIENVTRPS